MMNSSQMLSCTFKLIVGGVNDIEKHKCMLSSDLIQVESVRGIK